MQFRPEDPERKKWQHPEEIFDTIGLLPGMSFVDVGCGDGYFALPAARRVGAAGKVYAVDIDRSAVERLRDTAVQSGLGNLVTEVKAAEEAIVCNGCADRVFFGIDLHDFSDPVQVIRNAKKMLSPTGLLIDLDWIDRETGIGPPLWKRFSAGKARLLIESAGFRIRSVSDAGPYHYLIVAGL
ncbi:MAG TPA: methyltransferase domain-containing protein [Methanoregula sp.]|nr:methyltransferase domain-containing protein [Methanoregula sp.]